MGDDHTLASLCRAASFGECSWAELLQAATQWLGADKAMLMHRSSFDGYSSQLVCNHDPEDQRTYNEHYYKLDPRAGAGLDLQVGEATTGQHIMPNAAFAHTAYYHDVTLKADVLDSVHGVIADDFELGRRAISVQRGFGQDYFDDAAIARMRQLLPHLARALRDSLRLSRIHAQGTSCAPLIYGLIDPALNLHLFEGSGLNPSDILDIDPAGQRLIVRDPSFANAVSHAVRRAANGHRCCLLLRDCTLTLTQMPTGLSWLGSDPLAFFIIGERPAADSAALFADTFGLTPREREILDLLLVHERDVVGEKLGISGETLRWHIRNILAKTHYPNAAQLLGAVRSGDLSQYF